MPLGNCFNAVLMLMLLDVSLCEVKVFSLCKPWWWGWGWGMSEVTWVSSAAAAKVGAQCLEGSHQGNTACLVPSRIHLSTAKDTHRLPAVLYRDKEEETRKKDTSLPSRLHFQVWIASKIDPCAKPRKITPCIPKCSIPLKCNQLCAAAQKILSCNHPLKINHPSEWNILFYIPKHMSTNLKRMWVRVKDKYGRLQFRVSCQCLSTNAPTPLDDAS